MPNMWPYIGALPQEHSNTNNRPIATLNSINTALGNVL